MNERAQAFTLEAFVASLLVLASVAFALQTVGMTSNAPSTANEQLENQHRGIAEGVLNNAVANDSLRSSLLYWNETNGTFHDAAEVYYIARGPPTEFGAVLARAFGDRNVRYNVNVHYVTGDGESRRQRLVYHGTPHDDAVRADEVVTLRDDARLYGPDGTPTNVTVAETTEFYAPDAAPDSGVYNVLRVEVIVWRA